MTSTKRNSFFLFFFISSVTIFYSGNGNAQSPPPLLPTRTTESINPDGELNESAWFTTPEISQFKQVSPNPGDTPTEKTTIRLLYDDRYFYIGVTAYDPDPKLIAATVLERDQSIKVDDHIGILIDTYHDRSNALDFETNPLGTRYDIDFSQNGDGKNESWNTFWEVGCKIYPDRWVAEFRIPFSSLRFELKSNVLMGLSVHRYIKRKNEIMMFPEFESSVPEPVKKPGLGAEIVFENLKPSPPVYFIPHIVADWRKESVIDSTVSNYTYVNNFFQRKKFLQNDFADRFLSMTGLDVKWGLSKNLTMDFTLNTDFAQAEQDDRIVNLTRFDINLPEKREFFLEASDNFQFDIGHNHKVFNSRAIGRDRGESIPIIGGARLTGKVNGWSIGAMSLQTHRVVTTGVVPQNFGVYRLRKEVGNKGSYTGGIFTNRIYFDSTIHSGQSLGFDYLHRFGSSSSANAKMVYTGPEYNLNPANENGFYNLNYFKTSDHGWNIFSGIDYVQKNFNPLLGYTWDRDMTEAFISAGYKFIIKNISGVSRFYTEYATGGKWRSDELITESTMHWYDTKLIYENGREIDVKLWNYLTDKLIFPWNLQNRILIPPGLYRMYSPALTFTSAKTHAFSHETELEYGKFYGGLKFKFKPAVTYIQNRFLRYSLKHEFNRISFPDSFAIKNTGLYFSNVTGFVLTLTPSSVISIKAIFQYDDISGKMGTNLRFLYNPKEGTHLYLVVNQNLWPDRPVVNPRPPLIENQVVMVKFARTL